MTQHKSDPVSPALRKIEKKIDEAYRSNSLSKIPFAEAAYYILTTLEFSLIPNESNFDLQRFAALLDQRLNAATHAIRWLKQSCPPGGQVPRRLNMQNLRNARALLDLARNYESFYAAYTFASRGIAQLRQEGNSIILDYGDANDSRYEAYNRLIRPDDSHAPYNAIEFLDQQFSNNSIFTHGGLAITNIELLIRMAASAAQTALESRFLMPKKWRTSKYSFGNFLAVYAHVCAICIIQRFIRSFFTDKIGGDSGVMHAIKTISPDELHKQIEDFSGLDGNIVASVVADLTYGNRGIRNPDILLQPLISLNSSNYVITPSLILYSSAERNLTSLLNKIEGEKESYSGLVNEKEAAMREHIMNELAGLEFEFSHGQLPDRLPDVDLSIIDRGSRTCLVLELKWFIDPAEPREVIDRTKDLRKGIQQASDILRAVADGNSSVLNRLGIDASYRTSGLVLSQNWIGHSEAQSDEIPILNSDHFISVLRNRDIESALEWFNNRSFLPKEGIDYEIVDFTATVGRWTLPWYGIRPLRSKRYWPL